MASENVLELTDDTFEADVLRSELPVLVDFWGVGCAPCQMIAPMVAELADEYAGRMRVGKLNTGDNREAAIKCGVRLLPTLVLVKDGEIVGKFVGLQTKSELKAAIEERI